MPVLAQSVNNNYERNNQRSSSTRQTITNGSTLSYTNDEAIITEDDNNLQIILLKFGQTTKYFNLTRSVQKTESLKVFKEPRRCKSAFQSVRF